MQTSSWGSWGNQGGSMADNWNTWNNQAHFPDQYGAQYAEGASEHWPFSSQAAPFHAGQGVASAGRGGEVQSATWLPGGPDVLSQLPLATQRMLRGGYEDPATHQWVPFYVGRLKSFNQKNGYGFLEGAQSYAYFGQDVFIHKNHLPHQWTIGQPVEFAITMSNQGKPQATDVLWLPNTNDNRPRALPLQPPPKQQQPQQQLPPQQQQQLQHLQALSLSTLQHQQAHAHCPLAPYGQEKPAFCGVPHPAPVQAPTPQVLLTRLLGKPSAAPGEGDQAAGQADATSSGRLLGVLKSYYGQQAQGYLQTVGPEATVKEAWFGRSELGEVDPNNLVIGQLVEFEVHCNGTGQPQARNVNWDPVPLVPLHSTAPDRGTEAHTSQPSRRQYSSGTINRLGVLLKGMQVADGFESAVISAIDFQGRRNASGTKAAAHQEQVQRPQEGEEPADQDVDYVHFVLRRIPSGGITDAARRMKEFNKMLLMLMLAKLVRRHGLEDGPRSRLFVSWLEALVDCFDHRDPKVQEHLIGVVNQISGNPKVLAQDKSAAKDKELMHRCLKAAAKLRAKVILEIHISDGCGHRYTVEVPPPHRAAQLQEAVARKVDVPADKVQIVQHAAGGGERKRLQGDDMLPEDVATLSFST